MTGDVKLLWKMIRRPIMQWWRGTGVWLFGLGLLLAAVHVAMYSVPNWPASPQNWFGSFGYVVPEMLLWHITWIMWLIAAGICLTTIRRHAEETPILNSSEYLRASFILALAQGIPSLVLVFIKDAGFYTSYACQIAWDFSQDQTSTNQLILAGMIWLKGSFLSVVMPLLSLHYPPTLEQLLQRGIVELTNNLLNLIVPFLWICTFMTVAGKRVWVGWIFWLGVLLVQLMALFTDFWLAGSSYYGWKNELDIIASSFPISALLWLTGISLLTYAVWLMKHHKPIQAIWLISGFCLAYVIGFLTEYSSLSIARYAGASLMCVTSVASSQPMISLSIDYHVDELAFLLSRNGVDYLTDVLSYIEGFLYAGLVALFIYTVLLNKSMLQGSSTPKRSVTTN